MGNAEEVSVKRTTASAITMVGLGTGSITATTAVVFEIAEAFAIVAALGMEVVSVRVVVSGMGAIFVRVAAGSGAVEAVSVTVAEVASEAQGIAIERVVFERMTVLEMIVVTVPEEVLEKGVDFEMEVVSGMGAASEMEDSVTAAVSGAGVVDVGTGGAEEVVGLLIA